MAIENFKNHIISVFLKLKIEFWLFAAFTKKAATVKSRKERRSLTLGAMGTGNQQS
jgi:hypothetical protein